MKYVWKWKKLTFENTTLNWKRNYVFKNNQLKVCFEKYFNSLAGNGFVELMIIFQSI